MDKNSAAPSSQMTEIDRQRRRRERKRIALRVQTGAAKSRTAIMAKKKRARELFKHMELLVPDAHKGRHIK